MASDGTAREHALVGVAPRNARGARLLRAAGPRHHASRRSLSPSETGPRRVGEPAATSRPLRSHVITRVGVLGGLLLAGCTTTPIPPADTVDAL